MRISNKVNKPVDGTRKLDSKSCVKMSSTKGKSYPKSESKSSELKKM